MAIAVNAEFRKKLMYSADPVLLLVTLMAMYVPPAASNPEAHENSGTININNAPAPKMIRDNNVMDEGFVIGR